MQLDSPRQLYEKPENKFVAEFIGESSFLPVTRTNGSAYYGNIPLKLNTLPDSEENNLLMLRPESLRVVTDNTSHLPFEEMNIFEGEVRENVYQGESFLMYVILDDGSQVTVRGVTRNNEISDLPSIGERARLGLHQNDTVLIVNQEG
jgi:putative spermidine/putrescine transport system ATP-binding protein